MIVSSLGSLRKKHFGFVIEKLDFLRKLWAKVTAVFSTPR